MYVASFNSCWAKIERAKEHRDTLDTHIREKFAIEENRPRLGIKFDGDTSEHVLYVNYMPDLGRFFENVGVILGDALHNLRSALDHLAFQLALRNTNGNVRNERRVQFPIEDSLEGFERRCEDTRRGWLFEVNPDDRAIIERYQGRHRVHEEVSVGLYFHPLVMLRDLSDSDKHRLLPTMMVPSSGQELLGGPGGMPFFLLMARTMQEMSQLEAPKIERVELNTEIARVQLGDRAGQQDLDMAGYVAPVIALAEGRPVVAVIDKIVAVVVKVIREFDPIA